MEVKSYLDDAITRGAQELVRQKTVEKDHGRLEEWRHWQSQDQGYGATVFQKSGWGDGPLLISGENFRAGGCD